jgi:hypothetical protein
MASGQRSGQHENSASVKVLFSTPSARPWPACGRGTGGGPLSSAESPHMCGRRAARIHLGCAMETRSVMESVAAAETEPMASGGAKSETAEGVAQAIIRPVIVAGRTLGIVTAARDTVMIQGQGVAGWANGNRSGRGGGRSAQHRRERGRDRRVRWSRGRYRNNLGVHRDRRGQSQDECDSNDWREHPVHAGSLSCHHHLTPVRS